MFERSPRPPAEETLTKAERKEVKRLSRRGKKYIAAIAIGLAGPLNPAYWADVYTNQQELQNAELSITVEGPPLDPANSDTALVFLHGFNTYDATQLTSTIGPAYQNIVDGEMWSVTYGNADFAEEIITEEIVELAEERGIENVAIFGYSAGGTIGSGVERNVFINTDLEVLASIPTHSPANQTSLQPYQQSELEAGKAFTTIIPSSRYSKAWRWAFEMYFMRDRFLSPDKSVTENIGAFGETSDFAYSITQRKDLPSVDTLYQQIAVIDTADVNGDAAAIAEHAKKTGKTLPVHGYAEIAKPGYDYVVNNQTAAEIYRDAAQDNGIQFFTIDVPGVVHSRPDINTDAYMQALLDVEPEFTLALKYEHDASAKDSFAINNTDDYPFGAQNKAAPDDSSSGAKP